MKLRKKSREHKTESTIPLINIVFLMLIFFLVAGTITTPVSDRVQPPELKTLDVKMPEADLLQITRDGQIYWQSEAFVLDNLIAHFQKAGRSELKIMADRKFNAIKLVAILDRLRNAGVKNIKLVTLKGRGQG